MFVCVCVCVCNTHCVMCGGMEKPSGRIPPHFKTELASRSLSLFVGEITE